MTTTKLLIILVALSYCSQSLADEVGKLRDLTKTSEDYRAQAIDCLVEMKINKSDGWKSDECKRFKLFSSHELQAFKSEIQSTTLAFKVFSKSDDASKRRIKRGLTQLILIQENMESIRNIAEKIKSESNK